jgi:hypothetical protein
VTTRGPPRSPPATGWSGGQPNAQAGERHPHIHRALRELRLAEGALKKAAHDYQGHRVAAIKDIDKAIAQLHQALRADKN